MSEHFWHQVALGSLCWHGATNLCNLLEGKSKP